MSIILFCLSVRCVQLDFEFVLFVPSSVCMLSVLICVASVRVDQMVCVSATTETVALTLMHLFSRP